MKNMIYITKNNNYRDDLAEDEARLQNEKSGDLIEFRYSMILRALGSFVNILKKCNKV